MGLKKRIEQFEEKMAFIKRRCLHLNNMAQHYLNLLEYCHMMRDELGKLISELRRRKTDRDST